MNENKIVLINYFLTVEDDHSLTIFGMIWLILFLIPTQTAILYHFHKLDKSGNPILRIETKAGSDILLTYDKALEKYYHQDVYNLETPKNFDSKKARYLKPKYRIKYLKETVPPNKVIEFQIANAKSLSTENLTTVPGFISARKEPGTLYINKETGQVHLYVLLKHD
nr:hypothetical protein [Cylindrotheca closterium]